MLGRQAPRRVALWLELVSRPVPRESSRAGPHRHGGGPGSGPRFGPHQFDRRAADLKLSTRLRYAELLDTIRLGADWLRPVGDYYLDAVTPEDITTWLGEAARKYSGHTCLSLLRLLRTVTKDARRSLRLPFYACDGVRRPKPVKQYTDENPNALTAADLRAVYEEFRASEPLAGAREKRGCS